MRARSRRGHAGRCGPSDGGGEAPAPASEITDSVAVGAVLPWSVAARHVRTGVLVHSYGGYDTAKQAPVITGVLEATLTDRLTLRATTTNTGLADQFEPAFGVVVDVLREEHSGIDLALAGDYEHAGWNGYRALVTRVSAARTIGETHVQANAAFGVGTDGVERYGDVRFAGLHPISGLVYAGFDSRARMDLERDDDEPDDELDWDLQAGPLATLALGRWSVSATGGVSAWKPRSRQPARVGAIGAIGVGAVF